MRGSLLTGISALAFFAVAALADEPLKNVDPAVQDDPTMEVIVVTGEQPGPGLWKVSSGDHAMWILGEISPFPRRVKWRSRKFESVLRNSQELIIDFSGYWRMDPGDPRHSLALFKSNKAAGLILFAGFAADAALRAL